jgi:outer membrane scaffolding protein for murein synthesis (MipA/OmpV family)
MEEMMKVVSTALAGVTLAAVLAIAPAEQARADGGIVIGIGAYLAGDYVVGRTCRTRNWPLNIPAALVRGAQGKRVCRTHRRRK